MLEITADQMHAMVLGNRPGLIRDINKHLREHRPNIWRCYQPSLLDPLIEDSIDIASQFKIDDVYSMRLFVTLRWDISPGFYKQPQIAAVLMQTHRKAEERFAELATDNFSVAWHEAEQFDDLCEWQVSPGAQLNG